MSEKHANSQPDYRPLYPATPRVESRRFDADQPKKRSPAELSRILEDRDRRKLKRNILDESGKKLCVVEYDPESKEVISIHSEPYVNVEEVAENTGERIYITDPAGSITPERLTRSEARDQNKRYLIVTTLIFRENMMLIQKRSAKKKLDPGKLSHSAHGVAKEVFDQDGTRIIDTHTVALINSALEINEELRHGEKPFLIKVWPGTHDELFLWAKENNVKDSDTVWLVPEAYIPESGFPLGSTKNPRTRAVSAGFIFSTNEPRISIDPNELEGYSWQRVSEILQSPETADDLPPSVLTVLEEMIQDHPLLKSLGPAFGKNLLKRLAGEPRERTD